MQGGSSSDFIDGGRGNDSTASAVIPDNASDTFIFEKRFGHDTITDFEKDWDGIRLLGVTMSDISTKEVGSNDIETTVSNLGKHTILVQGAADFFDPMVDITFGQ